MGSLNPTFIPETITQFLQQLTTSSVSDKIIKLDDLVTKLQIEMRKIDAFRRELPLCMLLVNDAVVALKEESMVIKKLLNSDQPVFEEFMPIKKICDDEKSGGDKKNWLSSTQLWNANDDGGNSNQDQRIRKRGVQEGDATVKDSYRKFGNIGRVLIPLKGCSEFAVLGRREKDGDDLSVSGLSLIAPGRKNAIRGNILVSETSTERKSVPSSPNDQLKLRTGVAQGPPPQQETSRKQRRCWSTDLHRRFVNALQQLGGSQVATPKQIRELMQVENLTNDEVKSHLQKYRLHTRRHPSAIQSSGVFGGGLGMSLQDHYVESSKHGISQSGSPDGPLLIGTSTTGGDSVDDGEDSNSENYCWKGV